jgi:hypothetical protein
MMGKAVHGLIISGGTMGLTIHFKKDPPEALEQALGTEARYMIDTFNKVPELQRLYGDATNKIVDDCKKVGDKFVDTIAMVLSDDMRKLASTTVRLKSGDRFTLVEKYARLTDAEIQKSIDALIEENGPRVLEITYK